jgi:nucleoid-associated protein YgaU
MRNLMWVCVAVGAAALLVGCGNKASVDDAAITDMTLADVRPGPAGGVVGPGGGPTPGPTDGIDAFPQPPSAGTPPMNYTVAKGDSLFSISRRFYGDNSMAKAIFAANQNVLASPDVIKAGQTLFLPAKGDTSAVAPLAPTSDAMPLPGGSVAPIQPTPRTTFAPPGPPAAARPTSYTVQKGDSLFIIAKRVYGKGSLWTKIYEANRAKINNPDRVREGTVLTIPS